MVDRLAATAERFLSRRSFDLIVAPALADLEFEARGFTMAGLLALCRVVAGAIYEDITSDLGQAAMFVALTLIPACYYLFLFLLCVPVRAKLDALSFGLAAVVLVLSASPALACYWPEPLSRSNARTPESR